MKTLPSLQSEFSDRLIQLSTGALGLRMSLPVEVTPDDADENVLHMRASDETLDRYQEIITASGWRLDHYLKNPVIQNAHQYGDIIFTIGKALKTWVEGNELLQVWQFAVQENPFARIARDLYRGGFLNAASVGFIPIRWENPDKPEQARYSRKYLEQELLEVSAVGIPANPNALQLALKAGAVEKTDLRELAELLQRFINAPTSFNSFNDSTHLTSFCSNQTGPAADACATGARTDVAQLLQLTRSIIEAMKRA